MTGARATLDRISSASIGPWRRAAAGFLVAWLGVAAFLAALLIGLAFMYQGRVLPGVSVAGVNVSGLDRAAAGAAVRRALPAIEESRLVLDAAGQTRIVAGATLDRRYDVAAMLDTAFAIGRTGSPLRRAVDELRSLIRGTRVAPVVTYDQAAVEEAVAAAVRSLETPPRSATIRVPIGSATFDVVPATEGLSVDAAQALAAAEVRLSLPTSGDVTVDLKPALSDPSISTQAAAGAAQVATRLTAAGLTLRAGSDIYRLDAQTLVSWLRFSATSDGALAVGFDDARIGAWLTIFAGDFDQDVRDASLKWSLKGYTVIPAVEGRVLDVTASTADLASALQVGPGVALPASVTLAVTTTAPQMTTAQADAAAANLQLLGQWTTYFVPGLGNYGGRNIAIPTSQIDGTVLAPGAWFDFWKVVRISSALGYGLGGAIINGHTQETGALGGGICSCSTTLFNAALRAGLQMGARMNHYYYISRYPRGLDATVYKSDGGWTQDMTFRNDTAYPILIRGINGPGRVTFQIYGHATGRRVVLSAPVIANYHRATDQVQSTTSLRPGVRERVEWPADGFDAWVTRTVYDAAGQVMHRETYHSHYATITGLTLVGVAPSPTPSPSSGATSTPAPSPSP
jgi:vancomycin resistance protein YoaR